MLQPWEAATIDPEDTGQWGAQNQQRPDDPGRRKWRLALLGLAIALPLGGVLAWHGTSRPPAATIPRLPTTPSAPRPATADLARQAADTARAFLATSTLDERARFVRHPEITRDRMHAWYSADQPLRPLEVTSFHERWAEERVGNQTFVMLYMEMADFTTRAIAMEIDPEAGLKVDWESFESWSEMPWTQYLDTEPVEPVEFRVVLESDTYYNFAYADSAAWLCFRLNDPDNTAHCWGYCRADSEAAYALNHLLRRQRQHGTTQAKAILRLRFDTSERGRRQVLIESFVQDSWLKPDP